ncbi:hypothetical protein CPAR01_03093, partial [Colletotrichum paranaense]
LFSCHALGVASNPSICRAIIQHRRFQTAELEVESGFLVPSKANDSSDILEGTLTKVRPRAPESTLVAISYVATLIKQIRAAFAPQMQ